MSESNLNQVMSFCPRSEFPRRIRQPPSRDDYMVSTCDGDGRLDGFSPFSCLPPTLRASLSPLKVNLDSSSCQIRTLISGHSTNQSRYADAVKVDNRPPFCASRTSDRLPQSHISCACT